MIGRSIAPGSVRAGRDAIATHSRSFALAARLLPPDVRDRASIVYAWCRRADDAVDAPGTDGPAAVARLEAELAQVYAGASTGDPVVDGFAAVVQEVRIPRGYPAELLSGMAMDASGPRFADDRELRRYCFRVAGVVGLMMSHVMGLADPGALVAAARLGIAMQLTNICRDVREDWERGRLYVPHTLLAEVGAPWLASCLGTPLPAAASRPLAKAVARLLARAETEYRAGERGLAALPPNCRFAIAAARRIYAAIGAEVARRGHDVFAPRAVVTGRRKLVLATLAAGATVRASLQAWVRASGPATYRRDLPELTFEALA